jgi:hypothetical protein
MIVGLAVTEIRSLDNKDRWIVKLNLEKDFSRNRSSA